ncbi:MAG TPA: response regulator transcription factor [Herpetosiphonaceae bacterium]
MTRVLIVDDHPVFREGVRALLETQQTVDVVGVIGEGAAAAAAARDLEADVVLLDVGLPDLPGAEACRQIVAARPQARVLMLTANDANESIRDALAAGAAGYVLKTEEPSRLLGHITAVAKGETVLAGPVAEKVVRQLLNGSKSSAVPADRSALEVLTERERQVFFLAAEGRRNSEIAKALVLSEETIKTHLRNIYGKLGLGNKAELRLFAAQANLEIPPASPA